MIIIFSISVNAEICDNAKNIIASSRDDSESVDVADFNNDGYLDIIISETTSDDIIEVRLNNGFGSFSQVSFSLSVTNPLRVKAIDVDGDNDIDGIGTESGDKIMWFDNEGNGTMTTNNVDTGIVVRSIDAGDIDNDGDIDIFGAVDNSLRWYSNDGSETFTSNVIEATSYNEIIAYDIDDDNDIDLAGIRTTANTLDWFENDGAGTFTKRTITTTIDEPRDLYVIDLDGDGDIDIISGAYGDSGVLFERALQWYDNDGLETFTARNITTNETQLTNYWESIIAGDVNNDGYIDIIIGDDGADLIVLHKNDGNQNFELVNLTSDVNVHDLKLADLDNDDIDDLIFTDLTDSEVAYLSSIKCSELSSVTFLSCDFPTLFCDDFNYDVPLMSNTNNRWFIQLGGGSMNATFTPTDNELQLINPQKFMSAYHETDVFDTSYQPDSGSAFTRHFYSPVFSSEFLLDFANTTNSDNIFEYASYEKQTIVAYIIKAEIDRNTTDDYLGNTSGDMNWYFANQTQPSVTWDLICGNCTSTDIPTVIKINSLFQQRDNFPFNSSIEDDEIRIYADGVLIGTVEDYLDARTEYIMQYEIIKFDVGNFTIDDYYIMVGTDKDVSTFEQYYTDFFINETVEEVILGTGETGDMATALGTIWDDFGLKSVASRLMAGMFLLFLLAIVMFGASISMHTHLSPTVLIVVELFFIILLTYIKLLPIWLPFVIVLIGAGVGAIVFKMGTSQ